MHLPWHECDRLSRVPIGPKKQNSMADGVALDLGSSPATMRGCEIETALDHAAEILRLFEIFLIFFENF